MTARARQSFLTLETQSFLTLPGTSSPRRRSALRGVLGPWTTFHFIRLARALLHPALYPRAPAIPRHHRICPVACRPLLAYLGLRPRRPTFSSPMSPPTRPRPPLARPSSSGPDQAATSPLPRLSLSRMSSLSRIPSSGPAPSESSPADPPPHAANCSPPAAPPAAAERRLALRLDLLRGGGDRAAGAAAEGEPGGPAGATEWSRRSGAPSLPPPPPPPTDEPAGRPDSP